MKSFLTRFGALFCVVLVLSTVNYVSYAQPIGAPRVWSIEPTTDGSVQHQSFTVTFSDAVNGVDVDDFRVFGSDTASIQAVTATALPTVYRVTVQPDTTDAEIMLTLVDNDSITNSSGAPLGGVGTQNGNFSSPLVALTHTPSAHRIERTRSAAGQRSARTTMGVGISLKLNSAGLPVFAYDDFENHDLKLGICDTLLCTYPTLSTLVVTNEAADYVSMALAPGDIPVIAFSEFSAGNTIIKLKLAVCNNAACTSPTVTTIDSTPTVGTYVSLALTSTNIPMISYYDQAGQLKLAVCNNAACTSPTIKTIDSGGDVGQYSSLALTSSDRAVMSYADLTNGDLKLAVCADSSCSSASLYTIDSAGNVGRFTAVGVTSTDVPVIAYHEDDGGNLKLAVCNNSLCTSATTSTIDSNGDVGIHTSIVLTANDIPVVSYVDGSTYDLKLTVCDALACTNPAVSTIDSQGDIGNDTAVAVTRENRPVIVYSEFTDGTLKYALGPVTLDRGQPDSFTKSLPANNTNVSTSSVLLAWSAAPDATSYEYCVALSAASCTTWVSTGATTNATVTGLESNVPYYWQVRAVNGAGKIVSDNGTAWRFTVVPPPATFAKVAPANNATNQKTTVTLSWAASSYATGYEYCIARSTFTCVTWTNAYAFRTVTVKGLLKNTTYYWQVRAKNSGGYTVSSSGTWKFTTAK